MADDRRADADATHVGFNIRCLKCGCEAVIVDSSIGYSEMSGQWGSIDLVCLDCKYRTEIYG